MIRGRPPATDQESRVSTVSPDVASSWTYPPLTPELGFLRDIDRVMSAAELAVVTRRIAASGAWRDFVVVSDDLRDYRLIYENEHTDVWALSWLPGQETGFHDHDVSEVGITIVQGAVLEGHMRLGDAPTERVLREGDSAEGGFGYIHRVGHLEGTPAVSLHAYSPPLRWVGQYRQRDGRMLRLKEPGRTRLSPR
jgi:quercetin dioxygenase-like cupin family protein